MTQASDMHRGIVASQAAADAKVTEQTVNRATIVKVNGSIFMPSDTRFVWHTPLDGGSPALIFNEAVYAQEGLPVLTGIPLGSITLQILGRDPERVIDSPGNKNVQALSNPHGADHAWAGPDLTYLYLEALVPLMVYPSNGTFFINVVNGDYIYNNVRKTFNGALSQDISSHQPTTGQGTRYLGVYLDSNNTLQFIAGALAALLTQVPPEPAWPTDAFRLSVIQLDEDQTGLIFANVVNRRVIWATETLSVGGGGTPGPLDDVARIEAELDLVITQIAVDNNL